MYKIKEMCRRYNLSRSTLLYYDSIGLLKPEVRTAANYRVYSEEDSLRLEKICSFRKAGIPIEDIKTMLGQEENQYSKLLIKRFNQINREIEDLRNQQACITGLLKGNDLHAAESLISRDTWNRLMQSAGFDESSAREWHVLFERISPKQHTAFLKSLGFTDEEIGKIKGWSKGNASITVR